MPVYDEGSYYAGAVHKWSFYFCVAAALTCFAIGILGTIIIAILMNTTELNIAKNFLENFVIITMVSAFVLCVMGALLCPFENNSNW